MRGGIFKKRKKGNFNVVKNKISHLDKNNQIYRYKLGETGFNRSTCDRDLSVLMEDHLNMSYIFAAYLQQ